MDILLGHSTVRKFTDRVIEPALLHTVMECGIRASTTGNMQLYSIIVNTDKNIISELAPLHFNQTVASNAPVYLTFCADFNRFTKWCTLNNANPGFNNFLSFFTAAIDALLVAQNVCIAAENAGLGICYLGTVTYNASDFIAKLGLPKLVIPVATVAMGWPAENTDQADRLPLEAVVHYENYRDYAENDIRNIYAAKEQLESSVKFVHENKLDNLAQVYANIRYTKADNEYFSNKFLETLRMQGFMD